MTSRHSSPRRLGLSVLLFAAGLAGWLGLSSAAQQPAASRPVVHVIAIDGVIDLGLAPYVRRVIAQAAAEDAAAVVLRINTFGGRVDAAVQIRDALLGSPVRTVAFIDRRAISAGALIALACERIVMANGGTIGAATPVQAGQPGAPAQPVEEKTVSYVRKEFRATAEARGRPPLLAEAMVDADVEVPGIDVKGKLLTLTTTEALANKVADFQADDVAGALERTGLGGAEVREARVNWAENIVRWLTDPLVSSLLVSAGMLGILLELRTAGFGFAGAIGATSLALFFWGHWIVQLAGWEEVLLVSTGLLLLVFEFFVIPGFGIAGILGILATVGGLILALTGTGSSTEFLVTSTTRVLLSLLVAVIAGLALLRFLPRLPMARRLVLDKALPVDDGYGSAPDSDHRWLGRSGIAASPLRPSGIATLDGERVDVVSTGELIDAGTPVEVVHVDGNRVVVRRAAERNIEVE
jgi:membrane-bound serine protease (ClpP class)